MSGTPEPSVLIIGAGVFGTSTAYHLAKTYRDPSRITVVDRAPPPPEPAASTDINKIIRADYTSAFYSALAADALHAWATWPELKPYYHRTGWILLGLAGSDLAPRIRDVFRARGHDPTADVPLDEVETKWGGVLQGTSFDGIDHAYWNPEAGWCEAGVATASLLAAARALGVRFVTAEASGLEIGEEGRVVGVRTGGGELLTADKIVLATGAWTSSVLSPVEDMLEIPAADRVERQAQATGVVAVQYALTPEEVARLEQMPVVVYGEKGEVIPPPPGDVPLLKYTNVHGITNVVPTASGNRISIPPPGRPQHLVPELLKHDTHEHMTTRVMPTFTRGKPVHSWRLCWDARTPTQDWLLCAHPHPRLANVFFATGGSFHSYKFLPTLGKYMVNVLEGKSNGAEADRAWGWKDANVNWKGAHEKTAPLFDLREIEEGEGKKAAAGNGHV